MLDAPANRPVAIRDLANVKPPLARTATAKVREVVIMMRCGMRRASDYDGNENLQPLAWCGDPIEIK
jgi:hypothetical protein